MSLVPDYYSYLVMDGDEDPSNKTILFRSSV